MVSKCQNQTKQSKTKQSKTKQSKTKQSKTKMQTSNCLHFLFKARKSHSNIETIVFVGQFCFFCL